MTKYIYDAMAQANGSKSAQSSFEDAFVDFPHVGCWGLEGAKTPVPALKKGGGDMIGGEGAKGKGDVGVGAGFIVGKDIL